MTKIFTHLERASPSNISYFVEFSDRLKIAELALQLVLQEKHSISKDEQKRQLQLAAIAAIADYAPDSELNIFSDLKGEDFCNYPDEDLT